MNYINAFLFTEITCQPTRLNETKLNKLANICFSPLYYWKGRTIQFSRVSLSSLNLKDLNSREYSPYIILDELHQETSRNWIKSLLTIALIVPAILVGSIFKSLSLLDQRTREMFFAATVRNINLPQMINGSTIYLPASSSLNCQPFELSQEINPRTKSSSDVTIKITKKSEAGCPFGVVIHYNGETQFHNNSFSVQLANPTELTEARRSIWGRVTYPIEHNLTGHQNLTFFYSTEFSFVGKLLCGRNKNGKQVTCTEKDTATHSTTTTAIITDELVRDKEEADKTRSIGAPTDASGSSTYLETNHAFEIVKNNPERPKYLFKTVHEEISICSIA